MSWLYTTQYFIKAADSTRAGCCVLPYVIRQIITLQGNDVCSFQCLHINYIILTRTLFQKKISQWAAFITTQYTILLSIRYLCSFTGNIFKMTLTLSSVTGSTYQYCPSDPCQLCSLIRVSAITLFFKAFWSIIKSKVVMTCSQNTPLPSLKDGLMVSIRKTFISINAFFHFFCLVESFRVDFQFTMNTQPRVYELRPHKKVITTSWGFIYYPAV